MLITSLLSATRYAVTRTDWIALPSLSIAVKLTGTETLMVVVPVGVRSVDVFDPLVTLIVTRPPDELYTSKSLPLNVNPSCVNVPVFGCSIPAGSFVPSVLARKLLFLMLTLAFHKNAASVPL